MYLLDTNIVSQLFRKRPDPRFIERLERETAESLFTSCICVMELRHGAARLPNRELLWRRIEGEVLNAIEVLPITIDDAVMAGDILAHLSARGRPIDIEDILIGATALRRGLTVVTGNVRHFGRIPGLRVEDWLS